MADAVIQLPPDGTGKNLDCVNVTVAGNSVYREKHVIADPASNNYLSIDGSGRLTVTVAGGISGNAAAGTTGSAAPGSADYLGVNISGNLVGVTGFSLTNSKAAAIAIVDGSGNQITSFGGGTQFADNGASGATPTGTLSMGWDSANSKVRALKVDASQNLNVNINASIATVPVSGTFFQATQPVSIAATVATSDAADGSTGSAVPSKAIYIGGTKSGNLTGLVLDASSNLNVNLAANSFGTITVSGAVTANAGTNLNTSSLALDTSVNGILVSQGSATSGEKGPLIQGAVTTSAPSYTPAQTSPLSLDTSGLLRASLKDTPSNTNNLNVNIAASGATVTVSGTVTTTPPSNASTNVAQFGGTNVSTGTGGSGAGIPRVTIANDSSLAANQSVNVNQIAGSGISTAATGVQLVGIADGSGNKLTTNSTTPTGKFALDQNLVSILGTAPTTAGFLDIKGADGNVFVRQTNAANLLATVTQAAGDWKVNLDQWAATTLGIPTNFGTTPGAVIAGSVNASMFSGTTALTNTGSALDVNLKTSSITLPVSGTVTANQGTANATPWNENVAQFGGSNVVTGTGVSGAGIPRVTVSSDSFPATQAISAASLPLPANAAQETGGNLATLVTQTRNGPQVNDILASILSQIKLLNINFASCAPSAYVDNDTILLDSFPVG